MKGTLIQVNINVDSGFYTEMWCEEGGVLDQIEGCGVWPKGSRVTAQHDGAKAHTEGTVEGTVEDSSFTGDGKDDVRVDVVQQPSNSPDTNIWDIGAFNAHQKEFKRLEAFTNTKQRMMELVYKAWDKISWEVMDKSWACFFNNLRSIMQCRGDNNYKPAHNQGEKRQKDTGTAVDLSVNYEDYIACKDILARYNASSFKPYLYLNLFFFFS